MPIKSHITDPATGQKASVDKTEGETSGLVVATRNLKTYVTKPMFFLNDTYGADMNIGVVVGATPENVHDGIDKTQWTASAIVGGNFVFNQNNVHAKDATITVLDFNDLAGDDIVISINGSATTKSEPGDWAKGASNNACAINIANAINGITGVSASPPAGAVVTIIADVGYDIDSLTTTGAGADITVSARSVDATGALSNNVAQFDKGGDLDLSGYESVTGWIYLTGWNALGLTIYGWDVGAAIQLGNSVNIGDYINTGSLNVWQKFTISLSDLGISGLVSTFDALRVQILHPSVNAYLDYIQIQQTGTIDPQNFSIRPNKQTWLHVTGLYWSIGDALNTTLANSSMPSLSYDQILGEAELTSGILYQKIKDGNVEISASLNKLADFLQWPEATIDDVICDATNTFITIRTTFSEPLILRAEDSDELRLTINDDLSGLLWLRATVEAKEEDRST